jgi:hypothetical protein
LGTGSQFSYGSCFPERVMIARVYRTDSLGKGPRGRTSFEFDALDATRADADTLVALYRSEEVVPFGLRILTTAQRFAEVFDTFHCPLQASPPSRRVSCIWHTESGRCPGFNNLPYG